MEIPADTEDSSTPDFCFEERFLALFAFQKDGWLCDVEIVCDDGNVQAHRVILAATSSYFKHMFSSAMMECSSDSIRMRGMDVESLSYIVRYLYTNELVISKENALNVLKAANLLCLPLVEEQCCKILLGPMTKETALDYAVLAEQYGMNSLLETSVDFLVKHLKYFHANGLNKLDNRAFQMVVASDDLDVKDEMMVFDTVVQWIEHDLPNRKKFFKSLLEHVRLPLLPPKYLVDVVEKSCYVKTDLQCRDLVDEAKNRHLLPNRTQGYLSERMTPRKSTVGYIFLVGGLTVKERLLSSVERYDLPLQQSFKMPDMSLARSGLGCAIVDKVLYVIGGHDGTKALKIGECMDFGKGSWTWVPQMDLPRRNLGVCTDNSRIFAVGGQSDSNTTLNSWESYDPREGVWMKHTSTMNRARKYASVCFLNNGLFAVGGNDGTHYLRCCERYDLRADKWEKIAPLPHAFGANGLAVWDNCLYTVGGFDSRQCLDVLYLYWPPSNSWTELPHPMGHRRTGLGAVTAGHSLYAFGGHNGETYLDAVEMYDSDTRGWVKLPPLHYKRGAMAVSVLENCYMTSTDPL